MEGRIVTSIVLWLLPPPSLLQVIKNWRPGNEAGIYDTGDEDRGGGREGGEEMRVGRVEVEVGRMGRR